MSNIAEAIRWEAAVRKTVVFCPPISIAQQFARHKNIGTTQIYAPNLDRIKNRSEDPIAASIF